MGVIVVVVMMEPVATADMVMMRLLRRASVVLIPDDLRAILAELTVHHWIAFGDLVDALDKRVEQ